jgi:NADPH-dependent 2,4-dienoyl-CoA reductase/sulfur reductase-like enzyme/nitrite reductase/ring-hydroxylating ferredoxin subunit
MESNGWKAVAAESALKEARPVAAVLEDRKLLLVRLEGKIYACGNECSHYKGPLTEGLLAGHIVTCPWHNARFDVRDGRMVSPPALNDIPSYEVKLEAGQVWARPKGGTAIEMPPGSDGRTFVIVGAGAAGNAAAETLRREGFSGRIVLINPETHGPYDRTMLSKDYLSGEAPAKWLPLRGEKFYNRLQIELRTGTRVVSLDPRSRTLGLADGGKLQGDRLLLATGGVALRLGIPGSELPGCFTLRSLQDADALIAGLAQAEKVVLVGGSFIALEAASSLRHRGLEVHVVAPESVPLVRVFGEQIGRRLLRQHESQGVRFHLGRTAARIEGDDRVRQVELSDGRQLAADAVLIGVGVRPAVEFLAGSGLAEAGAVPVDARQQTAAEGIYAAGDIALLKDPASGPPRRIEHWVEAERQGRHAARAMLGKGPLPREAPFFWTRQHGQSIRYAGHAPAWDRVVFRGNPEAESFLAGFYAGGVLKAVAGVGLAREFIRLGQLLEEGRGLAPEQLSDPGFDLLDLARS